MRCQKLMVCVVLSFGVLVWAGDDRDATPRAEPVKGAVAIQGLEQLPAGVQAKLLEAIREFGPEIIDRAQRQEEQLEVAQLTPAVFLAGHEPLWLSDPELAQYLEDVAFDAVVSGVAFSNEGLSVREDDDALSFRVDTPEGIHLIQMVWEDDELITKFAAVRSWPNGNGSVALRVQMVDGKIQVDRAREHLEDQALQGDTAAGTGSAADASGDGCATTQDGVCCSFTNGNSIRIVCMCRTRQGNNYELCGDTKWLH